MSWKIIFSFIFLLLVGGLLFFYWVNPFKTLNFQTEYGENTNFSTSPGDNMQFYSNMRYSSSDISYKIENCPLKKVNEMTNAFKIISDKTALTFYPVEKDEDISVTCDTKDRIEGNLFIAGEGGPVNITRTKEFSVITRGKILLIRESECETPNIGIHELMHALGFDHSTNPNNIMYNISQCGQIIGEDSLDLINKLYSFPSSPDLTFENTSATVHGLYLDAEMSVRNNGLKKSEESKFLIYADGKKIYEADIGSVEIGYGRVLKLKNLFLSNNNIKQIELKIDYPYPELDKENNIVLLSLKKEK